MLTIHTPVSRCTPAPHVFLIKGGKGRTSSSSVENQNQNQNHKTAVSSRGRCSLAITSFFAALVVVAGTPAGDAAPVSPQQQSEDAQQTLSNIPQTLSGRGCEAPEASPRDCKKQRIQRPKSRKAESCTGKCVTTCIRGGGGSPGEGPLNIIRPLVVFKQGFRSRQYCLVECSDICNLIPDGDDGS